MEGKRWQRLTVDNVGCVQFLYCGKKASLTIGNVKPLGEMPEGTIVCCVEEVSTMRPHGGRGPVAARACSAVRKQAGGERLPAWSLPGSSSSSAPADDGDAAGGLSSVQPAWERPGKWCLRPDGEPGSWDQA